MLNMREVKGKINWIPLGIGLFLTIAVFRIFRNLAQSSGNLVWLLIGALSIILGAILLFIGIKPLLFPKK